MLVFSFIFQKKIPPPFISLSVFLCNYHFIVMKSPQDYQNKCLTSGCRPAYLWNSFAAAYKNVKLDALPVLEEAGVAYFQPMDACLHIDIGTSSFLDG